MAPLLEGAAMEEEENLQEKWAALLANIVSENKKEEWQMFDFSGPILFYLTGGEGTVILNEF